jgi:CheY-like chemotaxis protein
LCFQSIGNGIPLATSEARTRDTSSMLKTRTILLVDDETRFGLLAGQLVARGLPVVDVQGRDRALEVLRERTVDLIVLDMNIPAGLGICRAIRGCWDVPVIMVAPCDSETDTAEALDGGADDFVARPFGIDDLLARMRAALRRMTPGTLRTEDRDLVRLPCGHYQTEGEILRMAARISDSRKSSDGPRFGVGRPKKIATCRKCGASGGTLEMRAHKCAARMAASSA